MPAVPLPTHKDAGVQVNNTTLWVEELWHPSFDGYGIRGDLQYVKSDLSGVLSCDACELASHWLENLHGVDVMADDSTMYDESLFLSMETLPTFTNYLAGALKACESDLDDYFVLERRARAAEAKLALLERDLPGVHSVIESRYRDSLCAYKAD